VSEGVSPSDIINQGLIAGMAVVGTKFKANEFYVPEVLIAARAMHAGMDIVKPLLAETGVEPRGTVVIGTVKGDLHDIGKNLVSMMLEGGGWEVIDLDVDVAPEKFVECVSGKKPQLVALSALLTTTMPSMKDTIDALSAAGVRGAVKVMIGGAPVTQEYADEIGADGYAPDAASAVDKANELIPE
jgi:5-methyltetrahydrofolate--homocysteine methyltransferase